MELLLLQMSRGWLHGAGGSDGMTHTREERGVTSGHTHRDVSVTVHKIQRRVTAIAGTHPDEGTLWLLHA